MCFFNSRCPLLRLVLSGELTRLRVDRAISQSTICVTKYQRTHRLTDDIIFYILGYCIPWKGCLLSQLTHLNDLAASIAPNGIISFEMLLGNHLVPQGPHRPLMYVREFKF